MFGRMRSRSERRRWWLVLALALGTEATLAATFTLAVVPQHAPEITHREWAPFARRLGRETGHTIQLRVYRTFDEFETDFLNGVPELIYLNPYHQLTAHKAQRYLPLVRDGSMPLTGVLVVPRDSPVKSVRDLNGMELGFPDPNAFAASLYLRALLAEKERIRFIPRFYTSHGNVYRHVIVGDVAAGGGVNTTLAREHPATRAALRVLYETPGVAPHPLSVHPRMPPADREALIQAILRLGRSEDGRALLRKIQIPKPVRANFERDYVPLEKLRLHRYTVVTGLSTQ
jgi:phosphonate transport system substrate-binding protein